MEQKWKDSTIRNKTFIYDHVKDIVQFNKAEIMIAYENSIDCIWKHEELKSSLALTGGTFFGDFSCFWS